MLKSQARK